MGPGLRRGPGTNNNGPIFNGLYRKYFIGGKNIDIRQRKIYRNNSQHERRTSVERLEKSTIKCGPGCNMAATTQPLF